MNQDRGKTEQRTSVSKIQSESWTTVVEKAKMVSATAGTLELHADYTYDQLDALAAARGGTLQFTREEYFGYESTALAIRVEHVSKGRWRSLGHTRHYEYSAHEGWAIVPTLEYVLASIGNVTFGPAAIQIYPDLDTEATPILERSVRDRITAYIRGVCSANAVRVSIALPKDYDGHTDVMTLTYLSAWAAPASAIDALVNSPVAEETGEVVYGRPAMWVAPSGQCTVEDAVIASIIGLRDMEVTSMQEVPSLWIPQVHVKESTVQKYLMEFSRLAV